MNFRTTLILTLILAAMGLALLFTSRSGPKSSESNSTEGQKLIDLSSATVSRVSIAPQGEKPIVLVRDGVKWKLTQPITARADAAVATQLVDDLLALQSRGRLNASEAHSTGTGLDSPRFRVEVAASDSKSVSLDIGQRTASGDNLYMRRAGDDSAQIVAGTILDSLERPASAYREKKLFDLAPAEVHQVSIVSGGSTLTLARDAANSKWRITTPAQLDADGGEVSDLLIAMTSLSATDFVDEKVDDPKKHRLDVPQFEASFSTQAPTTAPATQGLATIHTVKFGGFSDVTKGYVFATTSDSSALMTIATSSMNALRKSPLDLRDRNLVAIDPNQVQSIAVTVDRSATTQPTTQPAQHHEVLIERSPPTTNPTSAPTSAPATAPASQPGRRWIVSKVDPKNSIDDASIDSLLAMFHPLRVNKYFASNPTTQVSEQIALTVKTVAPGGASATRAFSFTVPAGSVDARGAYNDAAFEPSRTLVDAIDQMSSPGEHPRPTPGMSEDETPFPPPGK